MANKREYKKSTRFSTYIEYDKTDLSDIINKIKETGLIPNGKYVSPSQIEPYLKELYFELIEKIKENGHSNGHVDQYKINFINLSQPIQLSLIKRFWVGDSFDELKSIVIVKLMEILLINSYDPEKSSLTSWIYENVYQVLLKNFKDEKEYEKKQISLINFDTKINSCE